VNERLDALGVDIGSRSVEVVGLAGGEVAVSLKAPTAFDPAGQCARLLTGLGAERTVATGYGRDLFARDFGGQERLGDVATVTEIQAYARGAARLFPEASCVLDIGGQDTKAVVLAPRGRVLRFEMNDRCAAGTGKFLEFMATALQVPLEQFGSFALGGRRGLKITSMCTVFAESEAVSLMGAGERPEDIALALHLAMVERLSGMLRRTGCVAPLVFAGGVARNPCAVALVSEWLGLPALVPEDPDAVGALGAALCALGKRGIRNEPRRPYPDRLPLLTQRQCQDSPLAGYTRGAHGRARPVPGRWAWGLCSCPAPRPWCSA
jgi:predicted CoA-substrate-specific enzyme activase